MNVVRLAAINSLSEKYIDRRYIHDVNYYRYIRRLRRKGFFNAHNILQVRYEDFQKDFRGTIKKVFEFAELPISEAMRLRIEEQHKKQSGYRPLHRNLKLEDFGLSIEKLAADLEADERLWRKFEEGCDHA